MKQQLQYLCSIVLVIITLFACHDTCCAFDVACAVKSVSNVLHRFNTRRTLTVHQVVTSKSSLPTISGEIPSSNYSSRTSESSSATTSPTDSVFNNISLSIVSSVNLSSVNASVTILSYDPFIFMVKDFLSCEECMTYQKYVQDLQKLSDDKNKDSRIMTRSNPPEVSLDMKKLWPLPLLSLFSGIPPTIRLFDSTTTIDSVTFQTILVASFPTIIACFASMMALGFFVIVPILRYIANSSSRTSDAIALNEEDDLDLIRPLVVRVTETVKDANQGLIDYTWDNWEAPVVTRYDVGTIFAKHGDASPTRGSEWIDNGGQRLVTCICYLNTLYEGGGGETYFDRLKLKVRPEMGKALFFYPADSASWEADDLTVHESLPPLHEEKWIVQLFGRASRVPPPLGIPCSFQPYSALE